jgi:drug/metabolite transporter (DMT)-like permease
MKNFTLTVVLGIAAAMLLGLGFVLQQRVARELPHADTLSLRLFGDLVGKPVWLLGIAAMVCGQLCGAAALGQGNVSLVEPLLATNLLFALLLARVLSAEALGVREWGGAVLLVAGVVLFIGIAQPANGRGTSEHLRQWSFLAVIVLAVGVLVMIARGRLGVLRANLLAVAAGLLFGTQDGLTRTGMLQLADGLVRLLTSWPVYAVVLAALAGLLFVQSAFEAAPLRASLPVINVVEPLTGIAFGIGVFGERIRTSPPSLVLEAVGLAAMIIGVVLLARSPMLSPTEPNR